MWMFYSSKHVQGTRLLHLLWSYCEWSHKHERCQITMPVSHCLHNFWIMPKSDSNMPNHHSRSFWVVSCWVANYFFFSLFNSWRVCTKIGYIGWYYWLAISTQSSSCSDVHSPQSSCYFLHLVTKRNLCNTLMSMLSVGIPKEQCQIQKLWSQMAFEISISLLPRN